MEMKIVLGEGDRVEASWQTLRVVTDQDGSAPAPFDLFLASLGTCVGVYVSRFCRQRSIETKGLTIVQRATFDAKSRTLAGVSLEIGLPPGFPERYRDAIVRSANLCAVKKVLAAPPSIEVTTRPAASAPAP